MSSSSVLAVVLVRDQPQLLQDCLDSLSSQEIKPDHVIVLDLRANAHESQLIEPAALGLEISTRVSTLESEIESLQQAVTDFTGELVNFVWVLSEDSVAAPSALRVLLREFEVSPSLAQIAPKLLHRDQTRRIVSLGLTASQSGSPLRRHADEYDQGQFDGDGDVLGANIIGSLFKTSTLSEVRLGALPLQTDFASMALALQLRAANHRIAVAPKSWVSVTPSTPTPFEETRLNFALRLALRPTGFGWLLILGLPIQSLYLATRSLLLKQIGSVLPHLVFALWYWLALPRRLAEQRTYFPSSTSLRSSLKPLLAARSEVRLRRTMQRNDQVETAISVRHPGFVESGSFWFLLVPLLLSMPLLPIGVHPEGLGYLPLSPSIGELVDSYLLRPDNAWILPLLALLWWMPGEPAAGLAWINFLAPAVAFLSGWQLFRAIAGVRASTLIAGLVYSTSPLLLNPRLDGQPLAGIAASLLPWVVLGMIRVAQAQVTSRRWRWATITGLLFAATASTVPILLPVILLLGIGFVLGRKFGVQWLLVMFIPSLAALAPSLLLHPANPWLALMGRASTDASASSPIWHNWTGDWLTSGVMTLLALSLLVSVAIVVQPRWRGLALLALSMGLLVAGLALPAAEPGLAMATVLTLLLAYFANQTDSETKNVSTIGSFSLLAVALLAVPAVIQPVDIEWRADSRVAPAIVHAAASLNPGILTLVLDTSEEPLLSSLWLGNGTHLDQLVESGDSLLENQNLPLDEPQQAKLTAALAAGSTEEAAPLLAAGKISFVLLRNEDVEVRTNLESSGLLESAGVTEWGRLWRVRDAATNSPTPVPASPWAIANFAIVGLYLLLAAPTPGSMRRNRVESSIFVDGEESQ